MTIEATYIRKTIVSQENTSHDSEINIKIHSPMANFFIEIANFFQRQLCFQELYPLFSQENQGRFSAEIPNENRLLSERSKTNPTSDEVDVRRISLKELAAEVKERKYFVELFLYEEEQNNFSAKVIFSDKRLGESSLSLYHIVDKVHNINAISFKIGYVFERDNDKKFQFKPITWKEAQGYLEEPSTDKRLKDKNSIGEKFKVIAYLQSKDSIDLSVQGNFLNLICRVMCLTSAIQSGIMTYHSEPVDESDIITKNYTNPFGEVLNIHFNTI
ncbi:MAG: hypothetical protein H0T62_07050 [Parachlamydiaceae bacterium]|nr:hypothetical protein [Parachlamydiaceae bacterium]